MSIEGQNFSSIENQPLNNEIQNETPDSLEQISAFYESHDFDTSYLQNSYEAFSPEQKEFLIQAYKAIQNNPDLLMEVMELPYDEDSFMFFRDTLSVYIDIGNNNDNNENQEGQSIQEDQYNQNIEEHNQRDEIEEERDEIEEKKEKTVEEIVNKINIEKNQKNEKDKKSEQEQEVDKLTELEKEKINNVYQDLLKDGEYKEFFNDNNLDESADIEEIKSFFAQEKKVIALFELAETKGPQAVEKLYNDLTTLNNLSNFSVAGLENFSIDIQKSPVLITGGTEVIKYGLDTSKFHVSRVEGDSLIYGDQKIDFGENPPVKYIKSGKFELKSGELDYKVDKQLRSDIFVLEHKIPQIDEKISGLESQKLQSMDYSVNMEKVTNFNQETLDFLFEQTLKDENNPLKNEIKNAIETVGRDNNSQNTEKLKSLLIQNSKKKEQEINILLTELNSQKHLAELKLDTMKDKLDAMRDAFKQKVLERDEIAKNRLKILQNMTQGAVDQAPLEEIFTEMNESSLQIDLGNGMIISGFDLDTFEISGSGIPQGIHEDIGNKKNDEIIARMMNIMFSGNPEQPIDLETIYTGIPVFKNEAGENISSTFSDNMRSKLGLDPRKYMRNNIENYNSGNIKESNTEK